MRAFSQEKAEKLIVIVFCLLTLGALCLPQQRRIEHEQEYRKEIINHIKQQTEWKYCTED